MTEQELLVFIGTENITLAQAMRKIDENTNGILFLVNKSKQLIGCITDGDIRRFLLAGGKIEDPVLRAANMHPKFAYTEEEAKALIVSGFAENVSKELPVEYAMEMNNLIRMEMVGSIG